MCGISSILRLNYVYSEEIGTEVTRILSAVNEKILERGPDAFGYASFRWWSSNELQEHKVFKCKGYDAIYPDEAYHFIMCNFRGIPTTELGNVGNRLTDDEIQPFHHDGTYVVHNGIIANDKEIMNGDRYMTGESLSSYDHDIDSYSIIKSYKVYGKDLVNKLEGSVSAIIKDKNEIMFLRTYLGLYHAIVNVEGALLLVSSSTRESLEYALNAKSNEYYIVEQPPYSYLTYDADKGMRVAYKATHKVASELKFTNFKAAKNRNKAIVVLSGGLDSTVCATIACRVYPEVHLIHFLYECKAQVREVQAVNQIAGYLATTYPNTKIVQKFIDMEWLKRLGGSRLTDDNLEVTKGELGAELAMEWVPARNLAMISVAAAYADSRDCGTIMLGLNREESAAYEDNSTEFYEPLNKAMAIGTKSRVQVVCPLGNSMKPHIVKMGIEIGAPLEYTWSCYEGGEQRCGNCGPCLNTRRAFEAIGEKQPWDN